jgi:hypothetical protein
VGCISLSDRQRDGVAAYTDIQDWLQSWQQRITPTVLTIFGGEPCLHPDLLDICALVRSTWSDCTVRVITNGYLLDNFDSAAWFTFGKFEIQVSVHRKDHEKIINQKIKNILSHRKDWRVSAHGGSQHKQIEWVSSDVSIYKSIFKDFIVPFKELGDNIAAWDSDPAAAHKICGSPATPILYKNKLYKCPPVANIIDLTGTHYADYRGYGPDDDLLPFINAINRPEPVCGQCPSQTQAVVIDHMDFKNVKVKQKISN